MYDVIIIGGGCAGLTAALYAARFRMKTLILTAERGGETAKVATVENWPGEKKIGGYELIKKMTEQVSALGVEMKDEGVVAIEKGFKVKTATEEYETKAVIFATGSKRRELGVPGEKEFKGKGVHYCASCDAPMYADKIVGVVGGSNAAAVEALLLAQHAKKVFIIYRKETIRADPINKEKVDENAKIEIINNTNVKEIKGDKFVNSVVLDTGKELELDGLFIEIGGVPATDIAKALGVELDATNAIKVNKKNETNVAGVFAAGDATDTPYKQIVTATAGGALAALAAFNYNRSLK